MQAVMQLSTKSLVQRTLPPQTYVCILCSCLVPPQGPKERVITPEITDGCKSPYGYKELYPQSLQDQKMSLTTESLQLINVGNAPKVQSGSTLRHSYSTFCHIAKGLRILLHRTCSTMSIFHYSQQLGNENTQMSSTAQYYSAVKKKIKQNFHQMDGHRKFCSEKKILDPGRKIPLVLSYLQSLDLNLQN